MAHYSRIVSSSLLILGLLLVGSWSASSAHAQGKQIVQLNNLAGKPVDLAKFLANANLVKQLRGAMLPLAQAGKAASPLEQDQFDTYVLIRIAELTWANGTGADAKREAIKRELRQFSLGLVQDLHDRYNQFLLLHLPAIAADPAVDLDARYNALILLGQIDRIEPNFAAGVAAIPLAEVTPLLVGAFDKADFSETLRIGALVGLARQAELQTVAGSRPPIATVAAKLIASKPPLAGFTTTGHQWARKLALQMVSGLAKTGSEMNRPETVKALYDILADAQEPLFLRRDAALALGYLDPNTLAAGQVKPLDLVKALSKFTLELSHAGGPRPDPTAEPTLTKAADVFLPPNDESKKLFTDGMSYYLNCVATALGGRGARGLKAIPGLDPKVAGMANELLTIHVDPAVAAMGKSLILPAQLPPDLTDRGAKLAAWMATNGLDDKPAAAAAVTVPTSPGT